MQINGAEGYSTKREAALFGGGRAPISDSLPANTLDERIRTATFHLPEHNVFETNMIDFQEAIISFAEKYRYDGPVWKGGLHEVIENSFRKSIARIGKKFHYKEYIVGNKGIDGFAFRESESERLGAGYGQLCMQLGRAKSKEEFYEQSTLYLGGLILGSHSPAMKRHSDRVGIMADAALRHIKKEMQDPAYSELSDRIPKLTDRMIKKMRNNPSAQTVQSYLGLIKHGNTELIIKRLNESIGYVGT